MLRETGIRMLGRASRSVLSPAVVCWWLIPGGPFCTLQNRHLFGLCLSLWTQDQTSVLCFPGRYASNRTGGFISLSFTLEKKKWMRSKEYLRTLPGESEVEPWSAVRHLSLGGGTWAVYGTRLFYVLNHCRQPNPGERRAGLVCVGGLRGCFCALLPGGRLPRTHPGDKSPKWPGWGDRASPAHCPTVWMAGVGTALSRDGVGEHGLVGSCFSALLFRAPSHPLRRWAHPLILSSCILRSVRGGRWWLGGPSIRRRCWTSAFGWRLMGFYPIHQLRGGINVLKKQQRGFFFFPYPNKRINMCLMSTHLWHFLHVRRLVGLSAHSSWFVATGEWSAGWFLCRYILEGGQRYWGWKSSE